MGAMTRRKIAALHGSHLPRNCNDGLIANKAPMAMQAKDSAFA